MERRVVDDGEELVTPRGRVALTSPAPGIVVFTMRDYISAQTVPRQLELLRSFGATNTATDFFYDLWELKGYDSRIRVDLTHFHATHRQYLRSLHACAQSKVVKMGIAVANVALRIIRQHADRASFQVALRQAIAGAKREPRVQ